MPGSHGGGMIIISMVETAVETKPGFIFYWSCGMDDCWPSIQRTAHVFYLYE